MIHSLAIRVTAASELSLMFGLDFSQLFTAWVGTEMIFCYTFVVFKRAKVYFVRIRTKLQRKKIAERNLLKGNLFQNFELGCMPFSWNDRSSLSPVVNIVGHWLILLVSDPCKIFNKVSNVGIFGHCKVI